MKAWFGIDSGKDGAVGLITETGEVSIFETPTVNVGKGTKREYDIGSMVAILAGIKGCYSEAVGALEVVHSMPGQGVASMFSQGRGYGLWEGILFALGLSFDYLTPQRWKGALLDGLPKEKSSSVIAAERLYPAARNLLITPRGRMKDGCGDALLIAEYRRRIC